MHINCISCGHRFDLGKSYDDYEGLVRCSTCRTLLDIRTQDGDVKTVRFGVIPVQTAAPAPIAMPAAATQQPQLRVTPSETSAGNERQAA
ncbi:MAG: hypothetical protein SFZ23_15230 [Planctomycetota bacterium]|nr:hypothetical protein [Planctomycetota bacterium]